jgi:hypothetical protein
MIDGGFRPASRAGGSQGRSPYHISDFFPFWRSLRFQSTENVEEPIALPLVSVLHRVPAVLSCTVYTLDGFRFVSWILVGVFFKSF